MTKIMHHTHQACVQLLCYKLENKTHREIQRRCLAIKMGSTVSLYIYFNIYFLQIQKKYIFFVVSSTFWLKFYNQNKWKNPGNRFDLKGSFAQIFPT
jgi:hypothetical protein